MLDYDIILGLFYSDGFGYREIRTRKPQFNVATTEGQGLTDFQAPVLSRPFPPIFIYRPTSKRPRTAKRRLCRAEPRDAKRLRIL